MLFLFVLANKSVTLTRKHTKAQVYSAYDQMKTDEFSFHAVLVPWSETQDSVR